MRRYLVLFVAISMGACSRPVEPIFITPEIQVQATQPVVRGIPSQEVVRLRMSPQDQAKFFDGAVIEPQSGPISIEDLGPDGDYRKLLVRSDQPVTQEDPTGYTVSVSIGFHLLKRDSSVPIRLTVPMQPGLQVHLDAKTGSDPRIQTATVEWVEPVGVPLVVDQSEGIETKLVPRGPTHAQLIIRTHKSPTDAGFVVLQAPNTHTTKVVSLIRAGAHHPYCVSSSTERKWEDVTLIHSSSEATSTPAQIRINPRGRYRLLRISRSGKIENVTIRSTTDDVMPVAVDVLGESGVRYSEVYVPNLNR